MTRTRNNNTENTCDHVESQIETEEMEIQLTNAQTVVPNNISVDALAELLQTKVLANKHFMSTLNQKVSKDTESQNQDEISGCYTTTELQGKLSHIGIPNIQIDQSNNPMSSIDITNIVDMVSHSVPRSEQNPTSQKQIAEIESCEGGKRCEKPQIIARDIEPQIPEFTGDNSYEFQEELNIYKSQMGLCNQCYDVVIRNILLAKTKNEIHQLAKTMIKNGSSGQTVLRELVTQFGKSYSIGDDLEKLSNLKQKTTESVSKFLCRVIVLTKQITLKLGIDEHNVGHKEMWEKLVASKIPSGFLPKITNSILGTAPKSLNDFVRIAINSEQAFKTYGIQHQETLHKTTEVGHPAPQHSAPSPRLPGRRGRSSNRKTISQDRQHNPSRKPHTAEVQCFNCKGFGHVNRECRHRSRNRVNKRHVRIQCEICKMNNHSTYDCKFRDVEVDEDLSCKKCHKIGHQEAACFSGNPSKTTKRNASLSRKFSETRRNFLC